MPYKSPSPLPCEHPHHSCPITSKLRKNSGWMSQIFLRVALNKPLSGSLASTLHVFHLANKLSVKGRHSSAVDITLTLTSISGLPPSEVFLFLQSQETSVMSNNQVFRNEEMLRMTQEGLLQNRDIAGILPHLPGLGAYIFVENYGKTLKIHMG